MTGVVHHGDCLAVLRDKIADESIDLIYLDPPFFSNKYYGTAEKRNATAAQGFEDRWAGGIDEYITWMRERATELHRVLKPTGSLYLHCDWHASHYLKVMLDDIFGQYNFLNNVVWCYGLGGSSNRYCPRKHDDILWYAKTNGDHHFTPPVMPATSNRLKGQMKKVVDYWDIPTINNMSKERLGYPTQKPELLLDRIINSSSRVGDTVLDPCCGSGTTLAVAQNLGRHWIGIDIGAAAVAMTEIRLAAASEQLPIVWDAS